MRDFCSCISMSTHRQTYAFVLVMYMWNLQKPVVSPMVISQTSLVSFQTCRSQFTNVQQSLRKRYLHVNLCFNKTVQNTVSVKRRLRTADYRLRTRCKMQTECKMQTAD